MPRFSAAMLSLFSMIAICDDALAGEQEPQAAKAASTPQLIAAMDVVVAPDGAITIVVPDAALPEPIRQLLVKRVSQWRYEAPMWQGKPAQLSKRLILVWQAVPTTSGGYAMRVLRVGSEWDTGSEFSPKPPKYPVAAQRKPVGGTFAYSVRVKADGFPAQVERRYPQVVEGKLMQALDASAHESVQGWRLRPFVVNGVPVACDLIVPIVFVTQKPTPSAKPFMDTKPLRDGMTSLCPQPALATRIENLIL